MFHPHQHIKVNQHFLIYDQKAKNAVLDVLFSFAIALPHYYVVRAEGVEITPVALAQFYESTLANLTLVNPTNRRYAVI